MRSIAHVDFCDRVERGITEHGVKFLLDIVIFIRCVLEEAELLIEGIQALVKPKNNILGKVFVASE